MKNKYTVPAALGMLLTAIIWGFAFVVVKNSLDIISTEYLLAFRFTIAAVALSLIFIKRLKHISLSYLKSGLVLGFFLYLSYSLQTYGCERTTAGKNAFLTAVYVILVPFLAWLINKKKPDKFCVIGAVIGIIGIGLISIGGEDLSAFNFGDVLTLICGFGYAIHMIYIDKYTEKQDPVLLTILQLAIAAIIGWIIALILGGGFPSAAVNSEMVVSVLYLGLLSTMLAFLLQNVCQKYAEPSIAAIFLSTEAVFGVVFSIIFLNEHLTDKMIFGCILMFLAIVIVETKLKFISKVIKYKR